MPFCYRRLGGHVLNGEFEFKKNCYFERTCYFDCHDNGKVTAHAIFASHEIFAFQSWIVS